MRIKGLAEDLVGELVTFDPAVWSGAQCAELVEVLARAETAIAVVRTRAALRAAACGEHRRRGFREPADWLARNEDTVARYIRAYLAGQRWLYDPANKEDAIQTLSDRTRLSAEVEEEVRRHFGKLVFQAVVPRSVRVAEAPSHGLPVTHYDRRSRGAEAYWKVAMELVDRA